MQENTFSDILMMKMSVDISAEIIKNCHLFKVFTLTNHYFFSRFFCSLLICDIVIWMYFKKCFGNLQLVCGSGLQLYSHFSITGSIQSVAMPWYLKKFTWNANIYIRYMNEGTVNWGYFATLLVKWYNNYALVQSTQM